MGGRRVVEREGAKGRGDAVGSWDVIDGTGWRVYGFSFMKFWENAVWGYARYHGIGHAG